MTLVLWILGGVGALVVLAVLFIWIAPIIFKPPEGISVEIAAPTACVVGEQFEIRVTVRNALGRTRKLFSVDLSKKFVEGIAIESVRPNPADSSAMLGTVAYHLRTEVPASGELPIVLSCKALREGDFRGNLMVYVDSESRTSVDHVIRTVVTEDQRVTHHRTTRVSDG